RDGNFKTGARHSRHYVAVPRKIEQRGGNPRRRTYKQRIAEPARAGLPRREHRRNDAKPGSRGAHAIPLRPRASAKETAAFSNHATSITKTILANILAVSMLSARLTMRWPSPENDAIVSPPKIARKHEIRPMRR